MDKIFTLIRRWLAALAEPAAAVDIADGLSARDAADLPPYHPVR
jgi:hypothetical protein